MARSRKIKNDISLTKRIKKIEKEIENNDSSEDDEDDEDGGDDCEEGEVYSIGNRIYFKGNVTKENIEQLVRILEKKNVNIEKKIKKMQYLSEDLDFQTILPKPVYLHISSYGGSVFDCLIAVDTIKSSKIPIHTVVEGYAASAGTLMSVIGVKRFIRKNSYMLIHQISTGSSGTYQNIIDNFKNDTKIMDKIKSIYKEHTKMSDEFLDQILQRDLWMDSSECLERGLVDEIF